MGTRSPSARKGVPSTLRAALPTGGGLSEAVWAHRHRCILAVLWVHVPAIALFGLVRGADPTHLVVDLASTTLLVVLGTVFARHRRLAEVLVALGLSSASGVLVHLAGGSIEMHFHFFVVVALITLYHDWPPFLAAIAYVTVHHSVLGILEPEAVYNHPAAVNRPVAWALIHGGFILAMSTVGVISWKLNEVVAGHVADREAKLAAAQRIAGLGSWEWDVPSGRIAWSDELYRLFGLTPDAFEPSFAAFLERVHPDDRPVVEQAVAVTHRTHLPFTFDFRAVLPDGEIRWMHSQGEVVRAEGRTPTLLAGTAHDITDEKQAQLALAHLAHHDPLTTLPNRALFLDRLGQALRQLARRDRPVAVLFMDLDGFKEINDSQGHSAGDRLLVALADRLREVLRDGDTVARFGGDEFAFLLPEVRDEDEAVDVAERIAGAVARPFDLDTDHQEVVTASIGIAMAGPGEVVTPSDVLRDADLAMYRAKELGRAGHALFDRSLLAAATHRNTIAAELRQALDRGELLVHYQPQVSLGQDTAVVGLEALVRWQHPTRGLVSPGEFIPVAERTGLIHQVDAWVMEEACAQLGRWQAAGRPDLSICVNVSARELADARIVDRVADVLDRHRVIPSTLCLEVTESILMEDPHAEAIDRLVALGVSLSVDDFGTGYSSLAYLQRLPADFLKIDKTFVDELGVSPRAAAIVRTIVDLAHSLGMVVVAEGVENAAQAGVLTDLGCDQAQGFLFHRPASADDVAEVLFDRPPAVNPSVLS